MMELPAETTIYVGKHFEVRDHDQPTKYVFNGSIRVARIIGSLSTNTRIQRFRLHPGWNLLSLAVGATNLSDQFQRPGVVTSAHSWNPQAGDYSSVPQVGLAGTVLWVNATTNATISVVGTYSDPVKRDVTAGATYLATTGLEAWTPDFSSTLSAWSYIRHSTAPWHARFTGDLSSVNDLPRTFAPGQALYVIAAAPAELEAPDPALRIRYYHQDHLGSSSVMTDANGALVEETAFYPFGIPRNEHRLRQIEESYKFTQKERDRETGLHYFEARYLAGTISRFLSVDPMYANTESAADDPQALNLYAYVRNNPLQYTDPTGLDQRSEIANAAALHDTRAAQADKGLLDWTREGFMSGFVGVSDKLSWGLGGTYPMTRSIIVEGYNVDTDSTPYDVGGYIGDVFNVAATLLIPGPKMPPAAPGTVTLFSKTPVALPIINPSISGRPGTPAPNTGGNRASSPSDFGHIPTRVEKKPATGEGGPPPPPTSVRGSHPRTIPRDSVRSGNVGGNAVKGEVITPSQILDAINRL
jgi:RHS repeat-associated protein